MKRETKELIKIDPRFKALVKQFGYPHFKKEKNYFAALIRTIIYQQLSGRTASKIHSRFLNLYKMTQYPSPHHIKGTKTNQLKNIGLSSQKINYILNLCDYCIKKDINNINTYNDREVSNQLIQIKGIGQWSVDMFLIFTLNRIDVFPLGDLGIKKGVMKFEKLNQIPSKKEMNIISYQWKPYRSIAAWYMWIIIEGPFEW